jgi:tetratricopeptide (TPR) repeat protein
MVARLSQPPFGGQQAYESKARRMQAALEKLASASEPAGLNQAIEACTQALAAAPDDPLIIAQLCFLKTTLGDFPGAEPWAARLTELLPSNPVGWSQLGMVRLKLGRLNDALDAFDRCIEVDPRDLAGLIDRANALVMLRRIDDAVREYHHVLRVHPGYSLAWISLGDVYAHTGLRAEAEKCYRRAVAGNADATLTARLARFCQIHGWPDAAATNYAVALKLEPTNAKLHYAAGMNLLDLKRYAPAADQLREAARLKPDVIEPRVYLGIALVQDGRPAEALPELEEVLRLDPTNALALEYARQLRPQPK